MLHCKKNPVGIDKVIDRIQKKIHAPLEKKWLKLDLYGRVYKNADGKGGVTLERYLHSGEYEPILYSEGNKIFFVQGNRPEINLGTVKNDLWAVCILNLEHIYKVTHRPDEEAHIDLVSELTKVLMLGQIQGVEYGMENLKRVVQDVFQFGNFKFSDMHPYHVFMVRMKVDYELTINEC